MCMGRMPLVSTLELRSRPYPWGQAVGRHQRESVWAVGPRGPLALWFPQTSPIVFCPRAAPQHLVQTLALLWHVLQWLVCVWPRNSSSNLCTQCLAQGEHTANTCGINKRKNKCLISKFAHESGVRKTLQPALALMSDLVPHPLPHPSQLLPPPSPAASPLSFPRSSNHVARPLGSQCWPTPASQQQGLT